MNTNRTVLVTGARGLFARTAIPELRKAYPLVLTDRLPPEGDDPSYRQADLLDFDQILPLMAGIDTVVHLAIAPNEHSQVSGTDVVEGQLESHHRTMNVNMLGTYNLLEAARRQNVRKFIFVSSLTVYFGDRDRANIGPETAVDPSSLYSCTKLFGENLGRVYHRQCGIHFLALRMGQPYPTYGPLDELWKTSRRSRSTYVTLTDATTSIRCAIDCSVPFGLYNVVSASDCQQFLLEPALEMGFRPRAYFSESGLSILEESESEAAPENRAEPIRM